MDKTHNPALMRIIEAAVVVSMLIATPFVFAQEAKPVVPVIQTPPSPPPPSAPAAASTDSDVAMFESWLKGNGQTAPPAMQSSAPPGPPPPVAAGLPPSQSRLANSGLVDSPRLTYRESQQVMLNTAPPAEFPPTEESEAAFNGMMQQNMPLSPQQVVKLRQLIDASQRAAAVPANVPPKPVSSTLMINLAPGATPPVIRLALGYVSSLVFVDSSGAPWPIASFDLGDPKVAHINWDGKSNVMLLQAAAPYSESNAVVRLVGLPTPVTIQFVSGQRVVDYRTDIHVPGIGPNTKDLPTGTSLPANANQLLLGILDGIAPAGSKQLTVKGGDCQAWVFADKMYLRTRFTVLSPGWIGKMMSPDGMHAYEIQKSSSVLISQYGNPIELKIEGF